MLHRSPDEYQEALIARALSHPWSILSERERRDSILAAYVYGAELAEATYEDREEAFGDCADYLRSVIKYCFSDARVINDVEVALWAVACDEDAEDDRLSAFADGFRDRRRALEEGT